MLSKLLKYEMKATSRSFLPIYIVLLALAVVNRIAWMIQPSFDFMHGSNSLQKVLGGIGGLVKGIMMFMFVCVIIGVFLLTIYVMIQRFYKNLLTDEGYLMFTLPVKSWKHILSKLVVSMLWLAVSMVATTVAILIVSVNMAFIREFPEGWRALWQSLENFLGASPAPVAWGGLLATVLGTAASILQIYAAICVGQLFNRHKIIGAFGAYVAINVAQQLLTIPLILLANFTPFQDFIIELSELQLVYGGVGLFILQNLVLGVIFFFGSDWILQKRLNLE